MGSAVRPWREEQRAKAARVAIIVGMFLALAVAALVGGRNVIAPPQPPPEPDPVEASRVGEIFFTMPGGGYCRHFSFSNATAKLHEGGIARCPDAGAGGSRGSVTGFIWGAR